MGAGRRLFVAVDLDRHRRAGVCRAVEQVRPLAPRARWVAPEKLHLTLQFLGTVEEARIAALETALEEVAALGASLPLQLSGAGVFGRPESPSVLWMGATRGQQELGLLARWAGEWLRPLGFMPDERAYVPHLTLARAAGPRGEPALVPCAAALAAAALDPFPVTRLVLMETLPDGRYAQVHAAQLPAWRFASHTSEVELQLEGGTVAGVLSAAARAFGELMLGEAPAWDAPGESHEVEVKAADPVSLLVSFLDELVFLSDTAHGVPVRARIHEVSAVRVRARVVVMPTRTFKTAVKAATLHGACCEQRGGAWHGKVVLDV